MCDVLRLRGVRPRPLSFLARPYATESEANVAAGAIEAERPDPPPRRSSGIAAASMTAARQALCAPFACRNPCLDEQVTVRANIGPFSLRRWRRAAVWTEHERQGLPACPHCRPPFARPPNFRSGLRLMACAFVTCFAAAVTDVWLAHCQRRRPASARFRDSPSSTARAATTVSIGRADSSKGAAVHADDAETSLFGSDSRPRASGRNAAQGRGRPSAADRRRLRKGWKRRWSRPTSESSLATAGPVSALDRYELERAVRIRLRCRGLR